MRFDKAEWRLMPFVSGRVAVEQDVKDGAATFYVQSGSSPYSKLGLPCLAELTFDDGTVEEIVVIQAEFGPNGKIICGCRGFDGGEHVCTLSELKIIEENKKQRNWRFWSKK